MEIGTGGRQMGKITSELIIGNVESRFDSLKRGDWDLYRAFYNGWIEGRLQIIGELKKTEEI